LICHHNRYALYQPAAAHAETGSGQFTQTLPAMRVANSAGQGVGGIWPWNAGQLQQYPHHFLYLFFRSMAVSYHRLLNL
jgi:hypothetical protein